MNINFLDLKKNLNNNKDKIKSKINNIIDNTSFIGGKEIKEFENNFSKYIGLNHFIGCANGTDALEIAVKSLNLHPEDEVLVQGNTYIATCLSVTNNNLNLILYDIDKNTNMICLNDLENKITKKTKVIIVVHLYGLVLNMEKLMRIVNKYNLILIEDCAQAHGAKWIDKCVGTFGKLACFSFYPGKNLGAFGDAGGIGTSDFELADKIRKITNLGCKIKYHHDLIGRNSRMDTIQAAVLDVKLESLEYNNELRRKNAQLYKENLKDISNIKLPVIERDSLPVFHLFVIMTEHRDELQDYLNTKGIVTLVHYPISIAETDAYKNIKFKNINNFIINSKKILSLPMFPELEEEEILYVCKNINYFFLENNLLEIKSINVNNKSGILNCINHLDFLMKRFFYIDQFNDLSLKRGFHSNENCDEILFIIKGSINLKLINKKNESIEKKVIKDQYYFIKSNNWLEFEILEKDTNIIVLANETLSKTKSIYNFDEFLRT